MKRTLSLIALAAICSAMMVSCKNNKQSEPTPEEIEAQKVALADSVLAKIDTLVEQYATDYSNSFRIRTFELTEKEKMMKPDYLLDPSEANNLVTKSQKINALGIYAFDYGIRILYDMPVDEVSEVMARLAADVNFPVDVEYENSETSVSEKIKTIYSACKERNQIADFWQLEFAISREISYVISQNPDLFFSKITEEQWQAKNSALSTWWNAVTELAPYDSETTQLLDEISNNNSFFTSDELNKMVNVSLQEAKEFRNANKEKYVASRNALLQ